MTIAREHRDGPFIIQCDECQDAEELEGYTFSEALADAKDRGYKVLRVQGEWYNTCNHCTMECAA